MAPRTPRKFVNQLLTPPLKPAHWVTWQHRGNRPMQTHHPYLEHSLAILQARLMSPAAEAQVAPLAGTRPFVTISREVCAGATTVSQLLMPMLNRTFGE